jgi:hypothetical protein
MNCNNCTGLRSKLSRAEAQIRLWASVVRSKDNEIKVLKFEISQKNKNEVK